MQSNGIPAECRAYYTLLVPWAPPEYATEWHCADTSGSWAYATLTRGNFATVGEAIAWGKEKLNGTPYSVKLCADPLAAVWVNAPVNGPDDNYTGLYIVIHAHPDGTCDLCRVPVSVQLTEALADAMCDADMWDVNMPLSRLTPATAR